MSSWCFAVTAGMPVLHGWDSTCCPLPLARPGGLAAQVHMLDPGWNPAVEEQAMDRVHRLGQQREVRVYRYVVGGSIEERMLELQVGGGGGREGKKVRKDSRWCFGW